MNKVAPGIGDKHRRARTDRRRELPLQRGADTLDWLAFRLLGLGCEFTVHEPPELIDHRREMAARAVRIAT